MRFTEDSKFRQDLAWLAICLSMDFLYYKLHFNFSFYLEVHI